MDPAALQGKGYAPLYAPVPAGYKEPVLEGYYPTKVSYSTPVHGSSKGRRQVQPA